MHHSNRELFPGITKADVAHYYQKVAPYLLPHLKGRPLTIQRFPLGITEKGFYQKSVGALPAERMTIALKDGRRRKYIAVSQAKTLRDLAWQSTITLHPWLSMVPQLSYPDRIIWDLDPDPELSFLQVTQAALALRNLLAAQGITSYCMLTGSRGLHVLVPIEPMLTFEETRAFARHYAQELVMRMPRLCTIQQRRSRRGHRVYIDVMRNGYGQTAVAPYSIRARRGAPVAMPVAWEELLEKGMRSDMFSLSDALQRLQKRGDIWEHREIASLQDMLALVDQPSIMIGNES